MLLSATHADEPRPHGPCKAEVSYLFLEKGAIGYRLRELERL